MSERKSLFLKTLRSVCRYGIMESVDKHILLYVKIENLANMARHGLVSREASRSSYCNTVSEN